MVFYHAFLQIPIQDKKWSHAISSYSGKRDHMGQEAITVHVDRSHSLTRTETKEHTADRTWFTTLI